MTTSLDQLKQTGTVVVSDSGDFECESKTSYTSRNLTLCFRSHRRIQTKGHRLDCHIEKWIKR